MSERQSALRRFFDSDLWWSFRHAPVAMAASLVALILIVGAVGAPILAPHQPFNLATLSLNDALTPQPGLKMDAPNTFWALTTRGATSSQPFYTARASPCWWA